MDVLALIVGKIETLTNRVQKLAKYKAQWCQK